ncbi:MAG: LytTR family DNA-binding domain-containing protein [Erythrobacter sp.]
MLRALIVDDERLARSRLVTAISGIAGVEIVGEASSGAEALIAIERENPSVVLLDIEMPDGDGFHVASKILELASMPEIIFVTAFGSYAVQAFDHGAIDYLLKPFSTERLETALNRARDRIRLQASEERAARFLNIVKTLEAQRDPVLADKDFWFRCGEERLRVSAHDIRYASADRDYVEIATTQKKLHLRYTIGALTRQLGGEHFIRIHRSHVVNKSAIRSFRSKGNGKFEVGLDCGTTLAVGTSYKKAVEAIATNGVIRDQ